MCRGKILLFFLLWVSAIGYGQLSKIHYIPPLTAAGGNSVPNEQFLYVSTPNSNLITVTIQPIGQNVSSTVVSQVSNANPLIINLETDFGQLFIPSSNTGTVTTDKGYIIEAEQSIYVGIRYRAGASGRPQAGALVSKGLASLGTDFRVGGFTNPVTPADDNYLTFASVLATEDATEITFSDLDANVQIEPSSSSLGVTSFTISLDMNESYVVALRVSGTSLTRPAENSDGLIGARIQSNKNIVVNVGSANGTMGGTTGRDHGVDQIVGTDKIGKDYIFVQGEPSASSDWDNVIIIATVDGTNVFLNGSATSTATLNAGEYLEIEDTAYTSDENLYVRTSEDVYAYQGVSYGTNANQGMFFVPPLSCTGTNEVNNIPNISEIASTAFNGFVTVVAAVSDTLIFSDQDNSSAGFASLTLGGGVIVEGPNPVTGQASYVTYKLSGLDGNVSISSNGDMYLSFFNQNGAATSGSFYSGFQSPPAIEIDSYKYGSSFGDCSDNVILGLSNVLEFDSFQWQAYNHLSDIWINHATTSTATTDNRYRMYRVTATTGCNSKAYTSSNYYVSVCPRDTDKDTINDNIDLDIENDGILNVTESAGDTVIDLSSISNPIVVFSNTTTNSSLSGILTTVSGTLLGNSSGTIQSSLPIGSQSQTYSLNYTPSTSFDYMNFYLEESTTTSTTRHLDEYFILKTTAIAELGKSISVVDPAGELLIDTNHDGVYESGNSLFTSEEIRFKWSGVVSSSQFYFKSNEITEVLFKHQTTATATPSLFEATLSLHYYYKSSNPLSFLKIADYNAVDSDGDGCDDVVEAGFIDGNSTAVSGDADFFNKGMLGTNTPTVDSDGLVTSAVGYLTPTDSNANSQFDFQENTPAPSIVVSPVSQYICLGDNAQFTVTAGYSNSAYQWQINSGGIWNNLTNTGIYSGVTSSSLTLTNPSFSLDTQEYRVIVSIPEYICSTVSASANLYITNADWNVVTPTLTLTEGGSSTIFGIALADQPSSTVVIRASVSPTTQMTVSPTLFTFTSLDWNLTQSVTVAAIDDSVADGNLSSRLSFTVSDVVSDDCYDPLSDLIYDFQIIDNETAGFSLTAISSNVLENSSSSGSFTIVLDTEPTSTVLFDITPGDATELSTTVSQIVFTNLNWNIPQTVLYAGVSDTLDDGDIASQIVVSINTAPGPFSSLSNQSVTVITYDDDDPPPPTPPSSGGGGGGSSTASSSVTATPTTSDGVTNVSSITTSSGTATDSGSSGIVTETVVVEEIILDNDGDGVPDEFDLDDDNDGILDTLEGNEDIDGDGIPNSFDLDSDGDNCLDVIEAGFSDEDNDGQLGSATFFIGADGTVLGYGGYNLPEDSNNNSVYDFLEDGGPAFGTVFDQNLPIVLDSSVKIRLQGSANALIQWEFSQSYSQDNDNANWQSIATLSAAVTSTQNQLTILNADESLADYSFRAFYQSDSYSCDPGAYTDPVQLYFTPLFIPNAFSPNGDGINDSWEIEGFEHFKSSEVTIYNRWGVVVYKASDYQNNWNGTTSSELQKSFTKLPNDTYFYVLILGDRQYKGYVYLRR